MKDTKLTPDEDGRLVAKNLGWATIDVSMWTLSKTIIALDISHNCLEYLTSNIGELLFLTDLNCSCNKLRNLPIDIGKLKQLKTLKANGNEICVLPEEIGQCKKLENLILSENSLTSLPNSISECVSLKVLHLQNNQLQTLPKKLAVLMNQVIDLDASNNPGLSMIPSEYRGNRSVIFWIVCFHYEKTNEIQLVVQATREMHAYLTKSHERMEVNKQHLRELVMEREELLSQKSAIRNYIAFRSCLKKWKAKLKLFKEPHIYY